MTNFPTLGELGLKHDPRGAAIMPCTANMKSITAPAAAGPTG